MAREQNLEVLKGELKTKPRVYYRNLWRYTKCFISGSISAAKDGVIECIAGANVQLVKNNNVIVETTSDNFGDFKFDCLDENSGPYGVIISANGKKTAIEVILGPSIDVGELRL